VVFTPLLPLPAQAALLLLLFAVITFSHVVLVPFKDVWINNLEFSVLVTTLVNISGVLLISGGATGDDGSSLRGLLLGLAVLAINLALLACIIYSAFKKQLLYVRRPLSKKWAVLVLFGQNLIERCRLGVRCCSRSSTSTREVR
jgi:hypothetical protein